MNSIVILIASSKTEESFVLLITETRKVLPSNKIFIIRGVVFYMQDEIMNRAAKIAVGTILNHAEKFGLREIPRSPPPWLYTLSGEKHECKTNTLIAA